MNNNQRFVNYFVNKRKIILIPYTLICFSYLLISLPLLLLPLCPFQNLDILMFSYGAHRPNVKHFDCKYEHSIDVMCLVLPAACVHKS